MLRILYYVFIKKVRCCFFMLKILEMIYNSKVEFYGCLNRVIGGDIVFWYEKYFK